jgi:hypothetical protein
MSIVDYQIGSAPIGESRPESHSAKRAESRACSRPNKPIAWPDVAIVSTYSGFLFAWTLLIADRKLLWTDELLTYYLARLPAPELWAALSNGPEQFPPVGHFAAWLSFRLLGESHVAVRLPSLIGFWMMSLAVFGIVRARADRACAAIAMLIPIGTLAYTYAYEGRPYGLLIGFSALALYFWQRCVRSERTSWDLLGLALCTALALGCHWFGVLLLVPISLGELARSYQHRRVDRALWLVLLAAVATLVLWSPMLENTRRYRTAATVSHVAFDMVWRCYVDLMGTTALSLAALVGASAVARGRPVARTSREFVSFRHSTDLPLGVALAGFLLIPVFGALLSLALAGQYNPRYVLAATVAISVMVGLWVWEVEPSTWARGVPIILVLVVIANIQCFAHKKAIHERGLVESGASAFALMKVDTARLEERAPIIVTSYHHFNQLVFYSPSSLGNRLYYVPGYSPMSDALLDRSSRWIPGRTIEYKDLLRQHRSFYIYDTSLTGPYLSGYPCPILPKLLKDGARIIDSGVLEVTAQMPRPGYLYLVELEPAQPDELAKNAGAGARSTGPVPTRDPHNLETRLN